MTEPSEIKVVERIEAPITLAFEELKLSVEAILFAADRPLEVTEIRDLLGSVSLTDVRLAIKDLGHDFEGRSVEIVEMGRRYQLRTRSSFAPTVTKLFSGKPRGLSRSSLETLAIVAYRQPVTRAEINALRQVDSSQVVSSLRERGLIYPSGTRKEVGHPVEYRTTDKFLEVFGLGELQDLPKLRSLQLTLDDEQRIQQALEGLKDPEGQDKPVPEDLALLEEPLSLDPMDPPEPAVETPCESPNEPSTEELTIEEWATEPPSPKPSRKPRVIDDSEGLARPVFQAVLTAPVAQQEPESPSQGRAGAVKAWISSEEDLEPCDDPQTQVSDS